LKDNNHGFDQNDGVMDGNRLVHSGHCTYCRVCNSRAAVPPGTKEERKGEITMLDIRLRPSSRI
jgi:hypothetical protein